MVKVERYDDESDEEWAERLQEEIDIANDFKHTLYFVEPNPYNEKEFIVNYIRPDLWTWKEHPECPFNAKQVMEWKFKAEKFDKLEPSLMYIAVHADKIVEIIEEKKDG